jgi:hypothetical protein
MRLWSFYGLYKGAEFIYVRDKCWVGNGEAIGERCKGLQKYKILRWTITAVRRSASREGGLAYT